MKVHIADMGLSNVVSALPQWPPHHQRAWPLAGCWLGWCLLSHSISAELPSCCSVAAALFCCSAATTLTAAAGQARAMVTGPGGGAAPGVGQMVNLSIV